MGSASVARLNWRTALELGRTANLPSVWGHCLVATVLVGGDLWDPRTWIAMLALSAMYLGGMYLNDAFDADWDAEHRPDRPIPSGQVSRSQVFLVGFTLVGLGPVLVALLVVAGASPMALGLVVTLATAIVLYDWHHKNVAMAPWLMGTCRALVYLVTAGLWGNFPWLLLAPALATGLYIVGITGLARTEHLNRLGSLWPLLLLAAPLLLTVPMGIKPELLPWLALTAWIVWQGRYLLPGIERQISEGVTGLLLALPLIDMVYLTTTGNWLVAGTCVLLFLVALWSESRLAVT